MKDTALPTRDELVAEQAAVIRQAMACYTAGEDEMKEEAVAELKQIAEQVRKGEFQ